MPKKVTIMGTAFTVTSKLKTEQILKLAKYEPQGLVLLDQEGNPEYAISYSKRGGASNNHGITFNDTDAQGYATLTGTIDTDAPVTERAKLLLDEAGAGYYKAGLVEEQALRTFDAMSDKFAAVAELIEEI